MDFFLQAFEFLASIKYQTLGFFLSLSLLIILHEFGHFAFSKIFNTRVEKFYLFFNAWFSILKLKKTKDGWKIKFFEKNKEETEPFTTTEYGMGWIPLGGFVKISGMVDESLDMEQMQKEPENWEFRSKTTWQRLLIMLGGVLVNFVLALFIYSMILFTWGQSYVPVENGTDGAVWDTLGLEIGLQHGDIVQYVDTYKIEQFRDIIEHLLVDNVKTITVKRNNKIEKIPVPENFPEMMLKRGVRTTPFGGFRYPYIADSIIENSAADIAGIRRNDKLLAINGIETPSFYEFAYEISKHRNKEIEVKLQRNFNEIFLKAEIGEEGKLGVYAKPPSHFYEVKTTEYSFIESFPAGISYGVDVLVGYVKQMKLVFSKEGAKQLGGFGLIGGLFPKTWDWAVFWQMTAFLSIILAFMNVLPIPALDGGHVTLLLYEIVTRRKPSDKFLEISQIIGMILLFTLLIYANLNDILRLIGVEMF
ncbi:MAG: RIP metalloprotease RseP [Bacteroidetes bacterium]|jgi:regulator of sigma E protease|nr:RIP metalloprotease RseP [Bacteroidota bacterium]MBT6685379.1 RIP metalloprotease RseP [Bacteroidota bacterium]MBT7145041.1 RIP metalloprotease RseP [Bacteroidota bacterium]MBT7492726.1 RIP metalloprotease RseP [Bacteroidota bacterium]